MLSYLQQVKKKGMIGSPYFKQKIIIILALRIRRISLLHEVILVLVK